MGHIKTTEQWYTGCWWMGCYTFGTARRGLGGLCPSSLTKCNSSHINGQCTNSLFKIWQYVAL